MLRLGYQGVEQGGSQIYAGSEGQGATPSQKSDHFEYDNDSWESKLGPFLNYAADTKKREDNRSKHLLAGKHSQNEGHQHPGHHGQRDAGS